MRQYIKKQEHTQLEGCLGIPRAIFFNHSFWPWSTTLALSKITLSHLQAFQLKISPFLNGKMAIPQQSIPPSLVVPSFSFFFLSPISSPPPATQISLFLFLFVSSSTSHPRLSCYPSHLPPESSPLESRQRDSKKIIIIPKSLSLLGWGGSTVCLCLV